MSFSGHIAIGGMTGAGKSYLAKRIVTESRARGRHSIVLTPKHYEVQEWIEAGATRVFLDGGEFLAFARRCENVSLVIDECKHYSRESPEALEWCAKIALGNGILSYFLFQYPRDIPPDVRGQCGTAYLFRCSKYDAEIWEREFGESAATEATGLPAYEFLKISKMGEPVKKMRL